MPSYTGLRFGARGLPLMGSGDWNDAMNLVGIKGVGESVWLGFFLCYVLEQFAKVAELKADGAFAQRCAAQALTLRQNLRHHGWDGDWYRRAYFDDGSPLGSAGNAECRIDSIPQSWSVLSGSGDAERARIAMRAVDAQLVCREYGLIRLLDPPFNQSELDPGYIKGYAPGVRENGGQYTHAAIWAAIAFAGLGDRQLAWEFTAMINPINHSSTPEAMDLYKVEPYVVAADIYAIAPHAGRGGWTWYTGSAGWLYRLILESLLGLVRESDQLRFAPCLPASWSGFEVRYRYGGTSYDIGIVQILGDTDPGIAAIRVTVDDIVQADNVVHLVDDRRPHQVQVDIHAAE